MVEEKKVVQNLVHFDIGSAFCGALHWYKIHKWPTLCDYPRRWNLWDGYYIRKSHPSRKEGENGLGGGRVSPSDTNVVVSPVVGPRFGTRLIGMPPTENSNTPSDCLPAVVLSAFHNVLKYVKRSLCHGERSYARKTWSTAWREGESRRRRKGREEREVQTGGGMRRTWSTDRGRSEKNAREVPCEGGARRTRSTAQRRDAKNARKRNLNESAMN